MNCQNLSRFLEFVEQMENQGQIGHCKLWYQPLVERIVTVYPVFLELFEQIRIKIGYGKVMILSTRRLVQKMEN